ncbi:MAG: hypothetical protein AB4041_16310 [Microcystaceae cyanobacterium]
MVQTIQAEKVNLYDLVEKFKLQPRLANLKEASELYLEEFPLL